MVYTYDPSKPRGGGGIRYVHNLIKYLLKNNINVILLGVRLSEKQTFDHPRLKFIPILRGSDTWWIYFIKLMLKAPFLKFSDLAVIHTHRTYFMLPFIIFHRKNPKICTLHMKPLEFVRVEYPQYFKLVNKLHKIVESFCLRYIDLLIAVNEDVKRAYEERYSWIRGKIKVVSGSGVDLKKFIPMDRNIIREKYGFNSEDKIILFVGRLEKIKNIDFLIQSFALVVNSIPYAKLVIVGRGSERPRLEKLASSHNLKDKVIFMGEINPEIMPEIYNLADVFVLSSYSETGPAVIKEALACGIPVVSTNVGEVRKLINKDAGKIVEKRVEKVFAEAIINTLDKLRKNSKKISKICRKIAVQKLNFENVVNDIIRTYKEVLEWKRKSMET